MSRADKWYKILFALYALLMLWLLFWQRMDQSNIGELQLRPLKTLKLFLRVLCNSTDASMRGHAWVNLLGNVAMFVPLGFLVPQIWQFWRKFWRQILLMTAIILVVELGQLLTGLGTCDVDDLLLNLVGTTIGFGLWKLCCRITK